MTDGAPTDNLDEGIDAIKNVSTGNIIACGAGANANARAELSNVMIDRNAVSSA